VTKSIVSLNMERRK